MNILERFERTRLIYELAFGEHRSCERAHIFMNEWLLLSAERRNGGTMPADRPTRKWVAEVGNIWRDSDDPEQAVILLEKAITDMAASHIDELFKQAEKTMSRATGLKQAVDKASKPQGRGTTFDATVANLKIVEAPGDLCGGTKRIYNSYDPCPGCRACR